MRIEYLNVNTNKLHDELIKAGIVPLLVESTEEKTQITYANDIDMAAVQAVIDAHDPTPLPPKPTLEQRNRADIDYIGMMTGVL
jgi:hypothetical protein